MIIGVPKEVKNGENRVAMTPANAAALVREGHEVRIESGAGEGSGFPDGEYAAAGVRLTTAEDAWAADLVVKVKEPQPSEFGFFRPGLLLFAYLHLAAAPKLAAALTASRVTGIAYETIKEGRSLPLLTPMSEIAGRMAAQIGAQFLEKTHGGRGVLLSGVPGVAKGKVTIIGGGVVGTNAAKIALGLGADVTIIDLSADRLRELDDLFGGRVATLISNAQHIEESAAAADLLIGAVLIPGAKAPHLVTEKTVASMKPGSVIVDVAVDQGGVVETIDRVTTHEQPVYVKHGVLHYAVANIPGAVPRTATLALTNATMPYAHLIARLGLREAASRAPALVGGINTLAGRVTHEAVARDLGYEYVSPAELL